MPIQIETTKAQVGVNITRPNMSIKQAQGELTITQTMPKSKIKIQQPKVKIDQTQCFAEAGLKNYIAITKEAARLGSRKALEAIARYIADGDRMERVEVGTSPAIPEIAKNAWKDNKDYNIATIPKSRPNIEFTGDLKIDWELGKTDINYKANKPSIDYKRGSVEVYLKQKPSIDIRYVDEQI